MELGYKIMISEMVTPDTVFAAADPANDGAMDHGDLLVFHPLNYSYLVYDPFEAHAINMGWIQTHVIDRLANEALANLDAMVYNFEHKYDTRIITFLNAVDVTENEDGSFSFYAEAAGTPAEYEKQLAREYLEGYL